MIEPSAVIEQARTWVGVRFLHQGRSRHGVDCVGFVASLMNELGVKVDNLPDHYARNPQAEFEDGLPLYSRKINMQPAALLMIKFPYASWPAHCAIYTGDSLIHCYEMSGKVVEHSYQPPWVARTMGVWALPQVMYQ